jgi:sec-independent protein translocase protein TatA
MPGLGHLPEIFLILLVALLVFGPRRMIEMGASLGKALRELRESVKDIPGMNGGGLNSLLTGEEPRQTPFSAASQFAQQASIEASQPATPETPAAPTAGSAAVGSNGVPVVEATVERVDEQPGD